MGKSFPAEGKDPRRQQLSAFLESDRLLTRATIQTGYFTSLRLYFLINVMGLMMKSTNRVVVKIK